MTSTSAISAPTSGAVAAPLVDVNLTTVALLLGTAVVALLAYYFIGVDQGLTSVFGKSMLVHEFFHDGRHLLGYPCH